MKNKIESVVNNLLILTIVAITKIVLELFYTYLVSPTYEYAGFLYDFNLSKYCLSWILFLILGIFMLKVKEKFCSFFLHFEFIITVLPMLIFYSLANQETRYMLYVSLSFLIQILILKNIKIEEVSIYIIGVRKKFKILIIFLIMIVVILTMLYNGFHGIKSFDTVYLYNIRKATKYPAIFSYFVMWTRILFIPFFIIQNLDKKKYLKASFYISLQVFLYMCTGEKFTYLILLVIISIYILAKSKVMIGYIYTGLIALISAIFFTKSRIAISFLGERFLFGPALNKFWYYDFFSEYPKIYFSDGILGKALGIYYQYTASSGQLIFAKHFDNRLFDSNSVTGMFGDSYSQLGVVGMILFSVLLASFIKVIAKTTSGISCHVKCSIIAIFVVLLNDAGFLTVFFSGGLFLTLYFFYVFLDLKNIDSKKILIKCHLKYLIKIVLKSYKIIFLYVIIFLILGLILSPVSYNYVLKNYNLYLISGDIEFNKLIFQKIYEMKSIIGIILGSIFLAILLLSYIVLIKFFISVSKIKKEGRK
ncbi:O-antigen polymerase [Fusobacterium periodonticum]|uniref:O-antigen polymerase n=1 Tax=Fusobacterium periodonticum ATCC 33693 TaxID=546275 RepID=D4CUC2_9FUSO|nr:O-antigen polymerase [Fusobacterium periodonticum]EFE87073.1 hypothetical protein FUSPEROL_00997 [Fusobacterium periodonticum ATCC 33693]